MVSDMWKLVGPIMIAAVALVLLAPPLSAFAQAGPGPQGPQFAHPPPHVRDLGVHLHHGQVAWRQGRWHHVMHNGRFGWWWVDGSVWNFYPKPIEGPPDYVSDTEVVDETAGAHPPAP